MSINSWIWSDMFANWGGWLEENANSWGILAAENLSLGWLAIEKETAQIVMIPEMWSFRSCNCGSQGSGQIEKTDRETGTRSLSGRRQPEKAPASSSNPSTRPRNRQPTNNHFPFDNHWNNTRAGLQQQPASPIDEHRILGLEFRAADKALVRLKEGGVGQWSSLQPTFHFSRRMCYCFPI